jgi:hypothetical protein
MVLERIESIVCYHLFQEQHPTSTNVWEFSQAHYQHTHLRTPTQELHDIIYTFMIRTR